MRAESRTMVTSFSRSEETASAWPDQLHGLSAAKQRVMQPAVSRPLRSSRQHVPKGTSCCSACTFSRSTSAPVLTAPEHQPVVHHEGLAGPGGWQQRQSYPCRVGTRGAVGATPRQLDVPRSADIICKVCLHDLVCPDVCLQDLSDRESCRNSTRVCPDVCPEKPRLRRECARRGGVPSGPK